MRGRGGIPRAIFLSGDLGSRHRPVITNRELPLGEQCAPLAVAEGVPSPGQVAVRLTAR
jgi:hypothetical protein